MNQFTELTNEEVMDIDGGSITLTTGALIALGCFGAGTALGIGWALCD